jgi:hypothetical protein
VVEVLRYKPEGRGIVPVCVIEIFHYGPDVGSASNRNEYQEYGLTTLPPSCADCLKIWEPQPPGTPMACNEIALPFTVVMLPELYIEI